jgi:hypothetical protein
MDEAAISSRRCGERGTLSIQDILPALVWHSQHHTAHITELRKRIGWPAPV